MADLMEEVQSILGHTKAGKPTGSNAAPVTEMKAPSDEARDLLKTHKNLGKMLQKQVDAVSAAFGAAEQQAATLDRKGLGGAIASPDLLGARPLSTLRDLAKLANDAVSHVDKVIKNAKGGRGSLGFREDLERYLDFLDARIDSLSEIRTPMPDPTPANAGVNDYSPELVAAAQDAADYISTPSALKIGSSVHIGRKSLVVVGAPKITSQGMLVHLEPPEDAKAHLNTGDAYTLMIPVESETSAPPSMTTAQRVIEPTAEAVLSCGNRSVKILAADLRINEEDYGDHMTDYGDYGPAMGRIKPGDKVAGILTPTVFRVIGKSGNSALVQPDSMDAEMYGRYKAASQYARTPVGQGVPSVPSVDQWKPGMGRIAAGADFPGRGGKSIQDTSTSAPQSGPAPTGGNVSLAGTRVLSYNPHSGKYQMATGKKPGDYEMADTIQIVGHDPALPTAVGESLTLDRFEHVLDEVSGDTVIAKLEAVVESGEIQKVNGVLMEPAIASVMLQLYRSVNETNQARMGEMGVHEMLDVSSKMLMRLTESKAQSKVKKKVEPHTWVVVKQAKDKYLVSIGDPKKGSSKAKFMGTKAELHDWAKETIGKKVSADHVVDLSGEKLVPDTYSQWYVDNVMKKEEGVQGGNDPDPAGEMASFEFRTSRSAERASEMLGEGVGFKLEANVLTFDAAAAEDLREALRDARISFTEAMGTHISENPNGTFSFVGDVPYRLGYIGTDGKELTDEQVKKMKAAHGTSTPALAMKTAKVKYRSFKSREEAEKAAKKLGVKVQPKAKKESLDEAKAPWDGDGGDKPMRKFSNEKSAAADAKKRGLKYGLSVAGGGSWYVGTAKQLKKAAVSDIKG